MIFTHDFVTRENYWQIASLVTQKSLFTVTHALFFIFPMPQWRLGPGTSKARGEADWCRVQPNDENPGPSVMQSTMGGGVSWSNYGYDCFHKILIIPPPNEVYWIHPVCPSVCSQAGFCTGNWSSLSLPVQTCIMLWVCSYWEKSVRAWNIHARWGFLEHLPMVF